MCDGVAMAFVSGTVVAKPSTGQLLFATHRKFVEVADAWAEPNRRAAGAVSATKFWRTYQEYRDMIDLYGNGQSSAPLASANELDPTLHAESCAVMSQSERRLVHELFEDQVRRTPNGVAAVHGADSLTYEELNRRANQLARYLVNIGVAPDELVGICVTRSFGMLTTMLGVLKAGGAYVPLDPTYPADRLGQMIKDSNPKLVLTQAEFQGSLPDCNAEVQALEPLLVMLSEHVDENLSVVELGLRSQHLVYVIYTSGSTGRPKGTAMAHRSMVNLIEWHRRAFGGAEGRRVLQFAALSFDVAFQETFTTLCTGGTLVLPDEWTRRDPVALSDLLHRERVERLFIPPLMLQSLSEAFANSGTGAPGYLQDIITAGEQLRISPEMVKLFEHLDGCRLHNHYGPTETHVVTALTLEGDPNHWPPLPSIGKPISNCHIHVLDEERKPVPIGTVGEIYIGGLGVARCYFGRPELTESRFIVDPFAGEGGGRLSTLR